MYDLVTEDYNDENLYRPLPSFRLNEHPFNEFNAERECLSYEC